MGKKITAPGPDGVPGRALALALPEINPFVRNIFNRCLQAGHFPKRWKTAKLVLIQKPGKKNPLNPSSYRPICLLDEIGKLFERVIASKINSHLPLSGQDLADNQYGFKHRALDYRCDQQCPGVHALGIITGWPGPSRLPGHCKCL